MRATQTTAVTRYILSSFPRFCTDRCHRCYCPSSSSSTYPSTLTRRELSSSRSTTPKARFDIAHLIRRYSSRQRSIHGPKQLPNHYAALGVSPNASIRDIKSKFYSLSKKHHPDMRRKRAPESPSSSSPSSQVPPLHDSTSPPFPPPNHKPSTATSSPPPPSADLFLQISDAYHILSHPTERSKYDKQYQRVYGPIIDLNPSPILTTSHSSHQAAAQSGGFTPGGRSATGLRNNRSPLFSGPPPSYFRPKPTSSGHNNDGSSSGRRSRDDSFDHRNSTCGPDGGVYRQASHWDSRSHLQTHHSLWQRRKTGGTTSKINHSAHFTDDGSNTTNRSSLAAEAERKSTSLAHFVAISGVLLLSCWSFRDWFQDESGKNKI